MHVYTYLYMQGPNQVWHLDGFDKLKPYGFCIHGCIDGKSVCMYNTIGDVSKACAVIAYVNVA